MLEMSMLVMSDGVLVYHGANRYCIYDCGRYFCVEVDVMDEHLENVIRTEKQACSTLSSAIATVEEWEARA